ARITANSGNATNATVRELLLLVALVDARYRPSLSDVSILPFCSCKRQILTRGLRDRRFVCSKHIASERRRGEVACAGEVNPASPVCLPQSVLDGDAGDLGALQGPAHCLGLVAIKSGEAGAIQLLVALGDNRFGKRIGLAEQAVGLASRRLDARPCFALAVQRANLDDPSGVGREWLDGAVLLNGLRPGAGIGVGQSLRAGGSRYARCRQDAEYAVAGAEIGRLRRHFGRGGRFVGLGPCNNGARRLRHFRMRWRY